MLIEELFSDPSKSLIYMERYVNDGSPSGFTFKNTTSRDTAPNGANDSFLLPIFRASEEDILVKGGEQNTPSIFLPKNDGHIPYPVHPDLMSDFSERLGGENEIIEFLEVYPTASARTVLACQDGSFFYIKLHYPKLIGRFSRANPYSKWISAFENQAELINTIDCGKAPDSFAFLRQDSGYLFDYDGTDSSGAGVFFREFSPYPYTTQKPLIPFFSLFSSDIHRKDDDSLLIQILKNVDNPFEWVVEEIVRPLLECYRFQAIDLGLLHEYNAQNLLLEISSSLTECRLVHRDMMGTFKDLSQRRTVGLHTNFSRYHSTDFEKDSEETYIRRSFAYDFKLGEYILAEIEKAMTGMLPSSREMFRKETKDILNNLFGSQLKDYFGSAEYGYGYDKVLPDGDRPYIKMKPLKYR